jgi:hypothetical protein
VEGREDNIPTELDFKVFDALLSLIEKLRQICNWIDAAVRKSVKYSLLIDFMLRFLL